jgi:hypothetical protein
LCKFVYFYVYTGFVCPCLSVQGGFVLGLYVQGLFALSLSVIKYG